MGNVVELKVEKHLEPTFLQGGNEIGALLIEQGHAHLEPRSLAREHVRKLKGARAIAVKGNDDAVFSVDGIEI